MKKSVHNLPNTAPAAAVPTANNAPKTWWQQHRLPATVLALLAFVLYIYSTQFEYALDDSIVIIANQFTKKGFSGIGDILTTDSFHGFFGAKKDLVAGGRYRPLSLVTFAIEYQLFGEKPAVSHFINVLLYCFTGVLLYRILCMLFLPSPFKNNATADSVPANNKWYFTLPFVAAALFVTHPLHTEVVANIKGRDEIITLLGSLGALYYILKYIDTQLFKNVVFAALCFTAALFTKENALTFLGVIPLTLFFFRQKTSIGSSAFGASMAALVLPTLFFLLVRYQVIGYFLAPEGGLEQKSELLNDPFIDTTATQKLGTIFYTWLIYLKLLIFPHPLTHDYYPKQIPIIEITDIKSLISIAIHIFLGIYALIKLPTRSLVSYGILVYLLTFSIVSNLIFPIGTFLNERFIYISSIGFCIVLAYFLVQKLPTYLKNKQTVLYIFGAVIALYSLRTLARVPAWFNNETLFLTDVNASYNSTKATTSAGGTLVEKSVRNYDYNTPQRKKGLEEAQKYLLKALEIYPNNTNALMLLGDSYYNYDHNILKVLPLYRKLLSINSNAPTIQKNVALMSDLLDNPVQIDSLLQFMEQKLVPFPNLPDVYITHNAIGKIYARKKNDIDKAIPYLAKSVELNPKNGAAWQDLGIIYSMKGNYEQAIEANKKALDYTTNDARTTAQILLNIGITYQKMNKIDEANQYYQKAFTLDPSLRQK